MDPRLAIMEDFLIDTLLLYLIYQDFQVLLHLPLIVGNL